MSNGSSPCKLFWFGRYTLDRGRASLMASGRPVALRPKAFDVLVYLVENRGRVVSKDELGETVWPGVEVTDESIAKSVSEVRLALGADGPQIIKTVPRRGYLFDVAAAELDMPASKPSAGKLSAMGQLRAAALGLLPPCRAPAVMAAALCLAVLSAGLLTVFAGRAGKPTVESRPAIAVLPFASEGEAQQEYFSDGITEDLTTSLGELSGLYVIRRHSAFRKHSARAPV
ncbi:MAG TPA: winged helix-turn-helix domain-containing protein [Xanthobacteraceae bacterium]|jgi:DNA-binding winged helix-turn-helix (wHTH) protein